MQTYVLLLVVVILNIALIAVVVYRGRKWVRRQIVKDRLKEAEWIEKDRLDAQARLNAVLANLRTEQQKAMQVHVFQFQKEFETYQALWAAATNLVKEFSVLMPAVDSLPPGRNWGDMIPERLAKFRAALFAARDTATRNRPFVHPEAYQAYDELAKEIILGSILVRDFASRFTANPGLKDYELMAGHVSRVRDCTEKLCAVIRGRIGALYKDNKSENSSPES